ncbi:hypothetical protein [Bythopirellula polymerisocia]|nr:hypothetical protein [Bythopirellula polymerisocia]
MSVGFIDRPLETHPGFVPLAHLGIAKMRMENYDLTHRSGVHVKIPFEHNTNAMNEGPKRTVHGGCIGGLVGGFIGYLAGFVIFCLILFPESNLCGLGAVFITGPAGVIVGILTGKLLARRIR